VPWTFQSLIDMPRQAIRYARTCPDIPKAVPGRVRTASQINHFILNIYTYFTFIILFLLSKMIITHDPTVGLTQEKGP
jgi:hypothetical protein